MSFFVTLPSNSSMKYYPNNTLSTYVTKLSNEIRLEGRYEVALTEIMFPYNWKCREDSSIVFRKESIKETFPVKFYAFETIDELFENINEFTEAKGISIKFYYNRLSEKAILRIDMPWEIEFMDGVHQEFGFKYSKIEATDSVNIFHGSYKVMNNMNSINSLYIYSDIAEYQHIGDSFAPLLRVVAVDQNYKHGEFVSKIFHTPDYVPVIRNNIDSIELDIRSDTGEPIQFTSGKILIKLHFRPKYGL